MSDNPHQPVAPSLIEANRAFAERLDGGPDDISPPSRQVAIVTCMDARIGPLEVLGLNLGEAHIIRNAGGIVTDDTVRSVCLSQRALGTREVLVIQHTRCGLHTPDPDALTNDIAEGAGQQPPWDVGGFSDFDDSVRRSVTRLRESPFLVATDNIRGFVLDMDSKVLTEVDTSL
jgi:carbonic anhydrase